ncbi:UDP-N-acetylmuramoylalanine--D-glutamate ligase [Methylacidimicrobium cyclopophantes]|uniref:UDP-N-acetylmuramoylalanine--D-glutamate ligase n=1 Tax=Methylacidimicrobium cyclopophantes TaxID=1041766 RepID=A0A5E6MDC6_9BACT|nr:UDP-N-acetylmuramoyl-L-alanine--D-glutamate ligase [Methylacidimicrobium cyclopophantes]VVM06336.1 UDP-N-acetylmuramoylalanine--D-glutamate ligase [Methylacidimicrobium cyclopophantes]
MSRSQDLFAFLTGKRILVWGLGREGRSTLDLLRRFLPGQPLVVADRSPAALEAADLAALPAERVSEEEALRRLPEFDLVLKAPGIPTRHLALDGQAVKITGQADLFLRFAPCPVVGVTGTKGKSTTASLLAHICRCAGRKTFLVGNIGIPPFSVLGDLEPESVVICELSSYQLEFARSSPPIALWTNLYPEHLNFHGSFAAYARAKSGVARWQSAEDLLIFSGDDRAVADLLEEDGGLGRRIPYHGPADLPAIDFSRFRPLGWHNRKNAVAALLAAKGLGIPFSAMQEAIDTFSPLPHRLEPAGVVRGISFYNDSISTVPESALVALSALPDARTLIVGGQDRGVPLEGFARSLARSPSLRTIILLPETGVRLGALLRSADPPFGGTLLFVETLEAAVRAALAETPEGSCCLFSPAAPSYNAFRNFEERGTHFRELIRRAEAKP